MNDPPNPGSDQALAHGCTCAMLDNNCGETAPLPRDEWWITVDCPVHNPPNRFDLATRNQ